MKKIINYLLLLCMLVIAVPMSASAEESTVLGSGKGGDGIYWKVHDDYTLEIYGNGEMENHTPAGAGWGSWIGKNIAAETKWTYSENSMEHIEVDTGVTVIGDAAFANCRYNESAKIGKGVEIIGAWAFLGNSKLETVYIPSSVKTIYTKAFYNCSELTDVYYGGTKAQWKQIKIYSDNNDLLNANIHYNSDEFVGDYINSSSKKPKEVKAVLSGGYNDLKVSWKKVTGAKGYKVYYKKATAEKYTATAKYTTKTSYLFEDLAAGTTYDFKVVPCFTKSKVASKQYTEISAATLPKMTAPTMVKSSSKKVKISWDTVDGVTGYQISKSTKKTGTNSIGTTTSASKTTEVTRNKTYYYKVRAYKTVNGTKIYTPWSKAVAYTLRYVYAVSDAKVVLTDYDDVKISWSKATGANTYSIYAKTAADTEYALLGSTTKTYWSKKNLKDGVKYTFKVVPQYKEDGNVVAEGKSDTASVTTLKKMTVPTVETSGTKVKVSWENIAGESGYQISKSTKSTGTNIVSTYKTTSGTYKTVSATANKAYYYKVRAYKIVNSKKIYGPWSDAVKYTRIVEPVTKVGTYEVDYGSTKKTIYVTKVDGNEVTFKIVFAGRYGSGESAKITGTAKNNVLSFTYKDTISGGKGKGTLTFQEGQIILSAQNTSGTSQLATGNYDETLVWVSEETK